MTPEQEEAEIIRNARAAYKAHEIDKWQLWDVASVNGFGSVVSSKWLAF